MPTKTVTVSRKHGVLMYRVSDLEALTASAKTRRISVSAALEERIQREREANQRKKA